MQFIAHVGHVVKEGGGKVVFEDFSWFAPGPMLPDALTLTVLDYALAQGLDVVEVGVR